jgi:hypothetical protein
MSNTNTGGPAFPAFEHHAGYGQMLAVGGMTLRDYFAAKAMQSILAREDGRFTTTLEFVGNYAYQYADAMLKAREA